MGLSRSSSNGSRTGIEMYHGFQTKMTYMSMWAHHLKCMNSLC